MSHDGLARELPGWTWSSAQGRKSPAIPLRAERLSSFPGSTAFHAGFFILSQPGKRVGAIGRILPLAHASCCTLVRMPARRRSRHSGLSDCQLHSLTIELRDNALCNTNSDVGGAVGSPVEIWNDWSAAS